MRGFVIVIFSVCCLAFLMACGGPGNEYSEYHNLPDDSWRYGDTLRFTPVHPDSLVEGRIAVGVRHRGDFRYSTLWLEVTAVNSRGEKLVDTLAVKLADEFGSWSGQGLGASFQMADTVNRSFIHRSGTPVKVRQIMRADTLEGVSQIGIFFIE